MNNILGRLSRPIAVRPYISLVVLLVATVLMVAGKRFARRHRRTAAITIACSLVISIVVVLPAMTVRGAYQNMLLRSMVQHWSGKAGLNRSAGPIGGPRTLGP